MIQLSPGHHVDRPLRIAVPADATPGQYITSIIVENDVPIQGSGSIRLDQVVRLAMAVKITIPGALHPALVIGGATHKVVVDKSVISVAVSNPGNARTKPLVAFAIVDAAGQTVSRASVQMDTFYAWTDTFVEVALDARLLPGSYTVQLVLDDPAARVRVAEDQIPLVIAAEAAATSPTTVDGPGLTGVDQQATGQPPMLAMLAIGVAGGLGVALALGLLVFATRRRGTR